jgi:hypothetical protein
MFLKSDDDRLSIALRLFTVPVIFLIACSAHAIDRASSFSEPVEKPSAAQPESLSTASPTPSPELSHAPKTKLVHSKKTSKPVAGDDSNQHPQPASPHKASTEANDSHESVNYADPNLRVHPSYVADAVGSCFAEKNDPVSLRKCLIAQGLREEDDLSEAMRMIRESAH